jgi:hypothetical protein
VLRDFGRERISRRINDPYRERGAGFENSDGGHVGACAVARAQSKSDEKKEKQPAAHVGRLSMRRRWYTGNK